MTRVHRTRAVGAALAIALVVGACSNSDDDASDDDASDSSEQIGTLPDEAAAIMGKDPYASARWLYYVADAESGEVLLASRADELVFTASTAKGFSVGSVYDTLGTDTRLTTPVYATTPISGGVVDGDLVLVASGDLALGGRNAMEGRFDHTFDVDSVDHVYADFAPNAARVGDPLAGLDDLARQIAEQGVSRVDGDVVIDASIWNGFQGIEGPVPPIFVNDNLVDVEVTGAAEGEPATIETVPQTGYITVESDVETVAEDGETALSVTASQDDPSSLVVSGTIAAGHSQLTMYRVPDAADWARALFIEALERAGIEVAAAAWRLQRRVGARRLRQLPSGPAGGRAHVAHAWSDGDDDHGDELQRRGQRVPVPARRRARLGELHRRPGHDLRADCGGRHRHQ